MTTLYKELIIRVCKIDKTDYRLGLLLKDVGGWYNTYRYKFHVSIVKLANEFKITHKQFVSAIYQKSCLINFFLLKLTELINK